MLRLASACSLLVAFTAVSLGLPPAPQQAKEKPDRPDVAELRNQTPTTAPPQAKALHPIIQLARRLNERIDFNGIDDPKTTLADALDLFRMKYGLSIDVRDSAFAAENVPDVSIQEIAVKPLRPMKSVKLATALNRVLSRVQCESGCTFVIRDDLLEITTERSKIDEFYVATLQDDDAPATAVTPGPGIGCAWRCRLWRRFGCAWRRPRCAR